MSKLSFAEAAGDLERICQQIDNQEETIEETLHEIFTQARDTLMEAVDRRIKYIKYTESQVRLAKEMRDEWSDRAQRLEKALEYIKDDTKAVIKENPGIPFRGSLGSVKIYKNATPSLRIEPDSLKLAKQTHEIVEYAGTLAPMEYVEMKEVRVLNKEKLKNDLKAGKEIPGISLEQGDHVRITLEI